MSAATIYLDYNATAPMVPEAIDAVASAMALGGNPSSVHAGGRAARAVVETARRHVAELVGAPASAVVFTSGASEANALALRGLAAARVLVSSIEHDSVLNASPDALRLPVQPSGLLDLENLAAIVSVGDLVSVMLVNNETGVIQDMAEIARIVSGAGARLHVDAVQAAGRIPLDFRALGATALSLSAHKIGGPPGVGALIVFETETLTAQTPGGGQERGRRGGTENMPGIAGFGAAAARVMAGLDTEPARLAALRDRLETRVRKAVPSLIMIGADAPRVGNTSCLALPGVPSEKQVMALDLAGYAISAGSACSSGKVKASPVLSAMGLPPEIAGASIRVSLGWGTGDAEIEGFVEAYIAMAARLARKRAESAA
jgi:cysteine desulfurase